ncbi:diguanylate cyclase domain-containing protein [Spirochaeta dissipatitropha]
MNSRNPTIGLQLTNVYDEYSIQLLSGTSDAAEHLGCNLLVFLGEALNNPRRYLYQGNVIYEHVHSGNIDALIASTGTLANFTGSHNFQKFLDTCRDIPVISLGLKLENFTSVCVDNTGGMEMISRHMIQNRGYRNPLFIHGPARNPEAQDRYKAFKKVMLENNLVHDSRLLLYGDFTEDTVAEPLQDLLDKKIDFDCIISSNDNMALAAMRVLQMNGIRIPRDKGISGFDNFPESQFSLPPLTTVQQPFYKQGWTAAELAYKALKGERKIKHVFLPTELVVRSSCNSAESLSSRFISKGTADIHKLVDDKEKIEEFLSLFSSGMNAEQIKTAFLGKLDSALQLQLTGTGPSAPWQQILEVIKAESDTSDLSQQDKMIREILFLNARIMISEAEHLLQAANRFRMEKNMTIGRAMMQRMTSIISMQELTELLKEDLPRFGITCAHLVAYEDIIVHKRGEDWKQPERLQMVMGYDSSNPGDILPVSFKPIRILPDSVYPDKRLYQKVISPLYFREEQLGYMVLETKRIHTNVFETLTNQIAAAMKTALLFKQQEETQSKLRNALRTLEHYSLKLKILAEKDELTGLYNRRGFLTLVPKQMELLKSVEDSAYMLYIDLDGMKQINDSFGHREGDEAIIATANILQSCLRSTDVIARMGGDEFVAFIFENDPSRIRNLTDRIEEAAREHNAVAGKPYSLSLSFGSARFKADSNDDIETLIHRADKMLYTMKRRKKAKHQNSADAAELFP